MEQHTKGPWHVNAINTRSGRIVGDETASATKNAGDLDGLPEYDQARAAIALAKGENR